MVRVYRPNRLPPTQSTLRVGFEGWIVLVGGPGFAGFSLPDRAKEVILELKDKEKLLYNEARFWKNEVKMLKQRAINFVEAELIEENALLKKECGYLRSQMQVGKRWK
ncbi:hypothetical protein COLO4_24717 [Corchorus olitorius]|uniref:Uncharacterized protein n=1 Tax=Corchorus olitorius TaxID=93759 RepID=A0A1R3I7L0_9ROSI|nr:hypothetical protein COLO4_24717 [Corchorus olitorius]